MYILKSVLHAIYCHVEYTYNIINPGNHCRAFYFRHDPINCVNTILCTPFVPSAHGGGSPLPPSRNIINHRGQVDLSVKFNWILSGWRWRVRNTRERAMIERERTERVRSLCDCELGRRQWWVVYRGFADKAHLVPTPLTARRRPGTHIIRFAKNSFTRCE